MTILCACCFKPPKPEGWYAQTADEAYCSEECREAHANGLCCCFCESDTYEMMGDEES